jgi:DNA replication protein DnaC
MSAPITEQAAALAIDGACRALRLPTVRAQHAGLAEAAARDRLTHRAFLAEVLSAELEERDARRRERRIAEARFPRTKRLTDFDLAAAPTVAPATLASLETLAWVTAGEPVVLLGDPGTGKSHCENGHRSRDGAGQTGVDSGRA